MAQQFVSSSAASIPAVNGGVALSMGASKSVLGARAPQTPDLGVSGSVVVEGNETAKAVAAGVFAHKHQRPLGFKVTNELANVPTSALNTTQNPEAWRRGNTGQRMASTFAMSHAYVRQTSTAFRNGDFNIFTGKFTTPPNVVQQCMYSINPAGPNCNVWAADKAVQMGPNVGGRLTFRTGAPAAFTTNYTTSY